MSSVWSLAASAPRRRARRAVAELKVLGLGVTGATGAGTSAWPARSAAGAIAARWSPRRVYLGAVVVLASALQHGVSAFRVRQLTELFGASRQTLLRWRSWWLEAFPSSRFWLSLRGRLMSTLAEGIRPGPSRYVAGRATGWADRASRPRLRR